MRSVGVSTNNNFRNAHLNFSKQLQLINATILSHECLLIISWLPSTMGWCSVF
jgi:hypothetical protein|tara:strand:- start:3882 stop:4040 length:159 start_codon:yes stop_codon:yes gene_type:complete